MTNISKKLEQLIKNSKEILPVKTERGIAVGDVLIVAEGPLKHLEQKTEIIYKNVHLNLAAIRLANLMALRQGNLKCIEIYRADQEYGKWFTDSQLLRAQYQKANQNQDYDRADMFWARYIESRDKTQSAKNRVESLCRI